ncbi:cadherin-15 [Scleropages formosus]|uniref:Cadherin 15, type 1, M-cadherin (myotubule) n=1 Tax=Scleropages formosus TaxID=113540 RepID=A0A8C9W984_SCLFO|nr:cadherin-15 [Scleropages formosus]XP_029112179.1 cadherin-15 [Scleropages formosus]
MRRKTSTALWSGLAAMVTIMVQIGASTLEGLQDLNQEVLHPWRGGTGGLSRVKRDWIIPAIRVPENSKQVPENLVQIKSDKIFTGEVIYKLEGPGVDQDPKDYFEIEDKTGWIRSKMPLDREKHSRFNLKAFALSPSGERLENPSTIEIVVLDQNDNRPNFTQSEFVGYVPEFSIPGTAVTNVSATDADDPATENAALSYSIVLQESIPPYRINKTMFGINNETGMIYTRDVGLDREVVKAFRLTLLVADMSGEGLSDTAYAIIHVTDINNHAPSFSPDQYDMRSTENTPVPEIGRVNVLDLDEPSTPNWRAVYAISSGDPDGHFAVRTDPETNEGILSVVKPLDYETQKKYLLTVVVKNEEPLSDKAPRGPLSSAVVTVTVLNVNEAPRFVENPIKVEVPESTAAGTVLTTIRAHNPENARLRYGMVHDPEKWLSINSDTGVLEARKPFNPRSAHVKNGIYSAVIRVSDTEAGGLSSNATLEIKLQQTNDFPPQLFPLRGAVCAGRRGGVGLLLGAVDLDLSPHAEPFHFKLLGDSHTNWTISKVNETHVTLYPQVDLDPGVYPVSVSVSDAGGLATSALVNVTMCQCDAAGLCEATAMALFNSRVGLSFAALLVIVGSILLLLFLLLLLVAVRSCRPHDAKKAGLLQGVSDDDVRDNVLNYDEQGGGEEDENAYNIEQLRNPNEVVPPPPYFLKPGSTPDPTYAVPGPTYLTPGPAYPALGSGFPRGKQPLRKDAPQNLPSPIYPRKPPGDPSDIEDFINNGLDAADRDPNVPPYDTALIYDYEGDGSVAGSLSSIASGSSDEDQDYDYLNDWGPRFRKLANLYDPH